MDDYQGFLLVSFGGPERAQDVMPFLERVTAGRGISRQRIEAVAEHYYANGGASPINAQCRELLAGLEDTMAELGLSLYWGNRNWHPLLEDTLALMRDEGVTRALGFVTSAYGGYSSCRQYQEDIAAARAKVGPGAPQVDKLRLYYNHPGWVGPWVASVRKALEVSHVVNTVLPDGPVVGSDDEKRRGGGVEVVFTAHSIPNALANTSPYVGHITESARLVAEGAGLKTWDLAWQSRSGPPAAPWLGPDITDVVAASRAGTLVVAPIGFVCDNMEIIHDLDVEAAAAAKHRGIHYVRAATVGTTTAFMQMVGDLARERLGPTAKRQALGLDGPWPDACPPGHCPSARRPTKEN